MRAKRLYVLSLQPLIGAYSLNNGFVASVELSALVHYLREIVEREGPFDGALGNNQGGYGSI